MAGGSINLPGNPERTKPSGNSLRRNSIEKPTSSNSGETILPHYLRASTGSCHDFCKYGGKHALEAKARRPILKRVVKKPLDDENPDYPVVSVVLPGMKKMSAVKLEPSPYSKTYVSDTPNTIERQVSTQSPDSQNSVKSKVLAERKRTSGVNSKSSSYSKLHISYTPKTIKQEVSLPSGKVEVSSRKGSSKAKELNLSTKHATSLKPISVTAKPMSSPGSSGVISGRRNSDVEIFKTTGTSKIVLKKVLAPPTASLSPSFSVAKPMSSPGSSEVISGRRNSDVKIVKTTGTSKKALKKVLAPPTTSLSPRFSVASLNGRKHRSPKVVFPVMNQTKIRKAEPKQPNNDDVLEKTLYVIKIETESKLLESDQNERCAVESSPPPLPSSLKASYLPNTLSSSSYEEEYQEESEYSMSEEEEDDSFLERAETVKEGYKGRPRKAGMDCSEDKNCQPMKLKFRRGKVVDIQSANNSPRKLKFRQGKLLGENPTVKADTRRKIFKRTGVDGNTNGIEPGAGKVVLRHQDVQGRKDEGLFNNVIEETASKLAETRKSKVKALVGAFETVISLQEKKPSANTVP